MTKIKCSYEDCFRHFESEKAMKMHKAKDEVHGFYCKKCNVDCIDDTELLFHQITGAKHTACPVCGREFKSESGRDRHVEIDHVPQQKIDCVGCGEVFQKAHALMAHIEQDQCSVIKASHFHRQRAERQISKDAYSAAMDPRAGSTILSANYSNPAVTDHMTLLDDERAWENSDWQGLPQLPPDHGQGETSRYRLEDDMSNLLINDKYPALGPTPREHDTSDAGSISVEKMQALKQDSTLGDNLLSHDEEEPANAWNDRSKAANLFDTNSQSTNLLDNAIDDEDSRASWGSKWDHKQTAIYRPVTLHTTNDPNTPNQQVRTVQKIDMPSYINADRFWNPITGRYICPGQRCGESFSTLDTFTGHLTSGAHVSRQVRCPSCLKMFKSTTALVAHCESGSRKCKIRDAMDYDAVLRELTAGIVGTDGYLADGSVKYSAARIEDW